MKKYGKLLSFVLIVFAILAIYYSQSSEARSEIPEFHFKKLTGAEKEIEQVMMEGVYSLNNQSAYLSILGDSTSRTLENPSIYESLKDIIPADKEHLYRDYKHFMRGKSTNGIDYENEDVLIYIDSNYPSGFDQGISNIEITVSILHKKSKEKNTFDVQLSEPADHVYVEGVRFYNDTMQFIVTTMEETTKQIHLYAMDWRTGDRLGDKLLLEYDHDEAGADKYLETTIIEREEPSSDSPLTLVKSTYEDVEVAPDMYESQVVSRELMQYDWKDEKLVPLPVPEALNQYTDILALKNQIITFTNISKEKQALEVMNYNLESKEVVSKQTFDLDVANIQTAQAHIEKDTIYVVVSSGSSLDVLLLVGNYKTGDILYKGILQVEGAENERNNALFQVNRISLIK